MGEELPGFPVSPRAGTDRVELLLDPQVLALPAEGPLAARVRDLSDLADAPWALDSYGTQMGVWSHSMCRRAGFEPRTVLQSPDPLLQIHMVRAGHAVGFVHGLVGSQYTSGTQLIELPGHPHRNIFTATRSSRAGLPGVVAFRQAMADAVADTGDSSGAPVTVVMPTVAYALGSTARRDSSLQS